MIAIQLDRIILFATKREHFYRMPKTSVFATLGAVFWILQKLVVFLYQN